MEQMLKRSLVTKFTVLSVDCALKITATSNSKWFLYPSSDSAAPNCFESFLYNLFTTLLSKIFL